MEELLSIGFINIDMKMSNVMIDKNTNLKIIDFGMTVDKKRMEEKIKNDVKYYIWPRFPNFTYSKTISYMLSVFILEIIYDKKVYDFQKEDTKIINVIMDNFMQINWLSPHFKNIILTSIKHGLNYEEFKKEIKQVFSKYDLKKYHIPSIYEFGLVSSGINPYPELRIGN